MQSMINTDALNRLFLNARSQNGWLDKPVSDEQLHQLYELMKWAPTSANSQPGRFLFLRSAEAKEKLRPALSPGNVDKTMSAPVVAIVAHDIDFHERLPEFFPHNPGFADMFRGDEKRGMREGFAFRNGSLQGAYLMMAARSIGLDCGPMSGFDQAKVDAAFFPGSTLRSNFLCNLGYGDPAKVMERLPRMPFEQACQLL
ncbi:MAG: malonic semialdehyde reductase [Betaproteobacteria bacterium]|nr:malonic semialdehyde reductase [Betaproteobacteria bacterium]